MGVVIELSRIAGLPEVAQLDAGERYAVVVPEPAAARRLADLVVGLATPPPGAVVRRAGPVRLVPAEGGLLPHLTVLRNLVRAYRVVQPRVPRARAVEACEAMANQCGLGDDLRRYPFEIAPGRRRLAGVARALCADATVIVLEDADGLPRWDVLLDADHSPDLHRAAFLLVTPRHARAIGFKELGSA